MKLKCYKISMHWLKYLFSGNRYDFQVVENTIPKDAELIRVEVDKEQASFDHILLYFYHESFPEIPEGMAVTKESIYAKIHFDNVHSDDFRWS